MAPIAPDAPNILSGVATAAAATVITIPAGRVWSGWVTVSAALVTAASASGVNASARATVTGGTATPPAGDALRVDLSTATQTASSTGQTAESVTSYVVVAAGSSAATIQLNATNTTTQSCSCSGVML